MPLSHDQAIAMPASMCGTARHAEKASLRLDLQRPVDTRLVKIEKHGLEGSNLFTGRVYTAVSPQQVQALSGRLNPGDQLVLSGTNWKDARFTFSGRGTETAPILIRPAAPGSIVFSGDARVAFDGAHLVITGLEFSDVTVARRGSVIFRLGNGKDKPADHCLVNRITIRNCNSPDPADRPHVRVWYMLIRGRDNTVANSIFAGLKNFGQMLAAQELPPDGLQRLHILNNRFTDRPYLDKQNGYEIIQIGWSGERARSTGSLIEGNVFERCDGENELITIKASDVVVCHNRFIGCQGVLCLRTADRVLVESNVFDGEGRPTTGGVRMQGDGHVIIDNVFRNLRANGIYYYWPISIMAASAENYDDARGIEGYVRATNIVIARNRFEANDARIAAGIYPRTEYPLLPRDIQIRDNMFKDSLFDASALDYVAPDATGTLRTRIRESGNRFMRPIKEGVP